MGNYQYLRKALLSLYLACFASTAQAGMLEESLIYHTYFGTVQEVQRLLNKGADPNAKDEQGWTALAIAAARNDSQAYPIAEALVNKGADINAAVDRDYPLINAIRNKNEPLVALLMSRDVSLNITDDKGLTAPVLAKNTGNEKIHYYIDKRLFEEQQARSFLYGGVHLWQIATRYVFNTCAVQYWGFYYKSKQDAKMDEKALKEKVSTFALKAKQDAYFGSRYFAALQADKLKNLTETTRSMIYVELDGMISNRNRRDQGVGKEKDFQKRCGRIVKKLRLNGTELTLQ
jgi:hypothetical protein